MKGAELWFDYVVKRSSKFSLLPWSFFDKLVVVVSLLIQLNPRARNVSRPWREPHRRYKSELRIVSITLFQERYRLSDANKKFAVELWRYKLKTKVIVHSGMSGLASLFPRGTDLHQITVREGAGAWCKGPRRRGILLELRFRGTKSLKVGTTLTDWMKREIPWCLSEKVWKKGSWRSIHWEKRKIHRSYNHNRVVNPEEEGKIIGVGDRELQ